jgi:PrtD family type I secretion system ABC transporter
MNFILGKLPEQLSDAFAACKSHFLGTAVFSAMVNILFLAPTLYMMQVYDRVVPTNGVTTLIGLTVIVGVAIGTLSALDNIRSRLMIRASLQLNEELSGPILHRLVSASRSDTTSQAMREFDTLRQTMTGSAVMAAFDVPWIPIYFIVAFMIHPVLGVMICVSAAILIGIAVVNERKARERNETGHKANSESYAAQGNMFAKAEIVRAFGLGSIMAKRQVEKRSEGLVAATQAQLSTTRYSAMTKFVRMFMQSAALGVGAWLAIEGQISVGTIIAASVLLSRALQPVEQLVGSWPQIGQGRNALKTLTALFESTEGTEHRRTLLPAPSGYVDMSNVTLRNPQGTAYLLRGISMWLVPGEVVGLVGQSGAGKSTLARVVAGAIKPDAGDIRIDDASYSDWDHELLAPHIGYLPQDSALLPGTIAENISRFAISRGDDPQVVDEKIMAAAHLAGVHELILRMPDGYNAVLGGSEFRLSGGQAQRIALARALYDKPKVLILDEPSASLDAEGEQALMRAVEACKREGAAILMVAHRAAVLANVDRLVVMAGGTIERQGPRAEVLESIRAAAEQQNVVNFQGR